MTIKLNHTIVHARDTRASASFYTELFGLPDAKPFGPFLGVEVANEVTLDFLETDEEIQTQHYAFLVGEAAAASTSKTPQATCSRSSRAHTASRVERERRR